MTHIDTPTGWWRLEGDGIPDEQDVLEARRQLPANVVPGMRVLTYGRTAPSGAMYTWTWLFELNSKKHHDFRVVAGTLDARESEVWMDGKKLRGVKEVVTRMNMTAANEVTITFIAGSINKEDTDAQS